MILWVVLFILVIAISLVLAISSMKDYQEVPTESDFGLYLIRKTYALTGELLDSFHEDLLKNNQVISFERLIKGDRAALVVSLPTFLALKYRDILGLLELEDYANVNPEQVSAWEIGIKNLHHLELKFPVLTPEEQFWMQFTISPKKTKSYDAHLRVILISANVERRKQLTLAFQQLAPDSFVRLPKAYSNSQIVDFYKKRSFSKSHKNPTLNPHQIVSLLKV